MQKPFRLEGSPLHPFLVYDFENLSGPEGLLVKPPAYYYVLHVVGDESRMCESGLIHGCHYNPLLLCEVKKLNFSQIVGSIIASDCIDSMRQRD